MRGSDAADREHFRIGYTELPEMFFARVPPTPVAAPRLLQFNDGLAAELGLDPDVWSGPELVSVLAGNASLAGVESIAMAYAGHQFGQWVPSLGDGRALQIGEVVDGEGRSHGLQLKGAGRTPFSRQGDGRAAVGPVLREYVLSEAMWALGIPTTRALAVVVTGEMIDRGGPEPGAILTRVARGFVRVGTFEYFARRGQSQAVRALADFVIAQNSPHSLPTANAYRSWFEGVIEAQANLIAQWMSVGFIHGVMNTDNMSVFGETIDYGPCAFMDAYDAQKVFSSIDRHGRYAYQQQPGIGLWNLTRLAECLLGLFDDDEEAAIEWAQGALGAYAEKFHAAYDERFRRKLGLQVSSEESRRLVSELLGLMAQGKADFTLTFRGLSEGSGSTQEGRSPLGLSPEEDLRFQAWWGEWQTALEREGQPEALRCAEMRKVNPLFIPRNHRVQQVIDDWVERADLGSLKTLLEVTRQPFDEHPNARDWARAPEPHEVIQETFCGT